MSLLINDDGNIEFPKVLEFVDIIGDQFSEVSCAYRHLNTFLILLPFGSRVKAEIEYVSTLCETKVIVHEHYKLPEFDRSNCDVVESGEEGELIAIEITCDNGNGVIHYFPSEEVSAFLFANAV